MQPRQTPLGLGLHLFQQHHRVEDVYPRRQNGSQHEVPTVCELMRTSLFNRKLTQSVKQKDVLQEEKSSPSPRSSAGLRCPPSAKLLLIENR